VFHCVSGIIDRTGNGQQINPKNLIGTQRNKWPKGTNIKWTLAGPLIKITSRSYSE